MKLWKLRVQSNHWAAYKPRGCDKATVTGVCWDEEAGRVCFELLFDNGAVDWVPAFEVGPGDAPYRILLPDGQGLR